MFILTLVAVAFSVVEGQWLYIPCALLVFAFWWWVSAGRLRWHREARDTLERAPRRPLD